MTRIPKATRETFPDELKYVWDRVIADPANGGDAAGAANIFLTMGNNPQVQIGRAHV